MSLDEYQDASELFAGDVFEAISLDTCVKGRNVLGGPAPEMVKEQIAQTRPLFE